MAENFDLLVIGESAASLCAAAAAAQAGARVALLRPEEKSFSADSGSISAIPNFVWRRFDLHDYGLTLEPVSARVTLFDDGLSVVTKRFPGQTKESLEHPTPADFLLWEDFVNQTERLSEVADFSARASNGKSLAGIFSGTKKLDAYSTLAGSCHTLLDDFFTDEKLKTHLCAHALSASGYGGAESGSAHGIPELFADNSWREKATEDGPPLMRVLQSVCEKNGVEFRDGALAAIEKENGKFQKAVLKKGEPVKTRLIFFAEPLAAKQAGVSAGVWPLRNDRHATAVMRLSLDGPIDPPAGDRNAVFQIADSRMILQESRDDAAAGRLPDKLPMEFEFDPNGDLIARSAYCPRSFREDGEARGWTSQDRQAVVARMKERLASRLPGISERIKKESIEIFGAADEGFEQSFGIGENIIVQPHSHNAIAAAVTMVDEVLSRE